MLSMSGVSKAYGTHSRRTAVITDATLDISAGEFCTLIGASGSGKSTLLNIIGLLDRPTTGEYRLWGHQARSLSDKVAADIRRKNIGFVFQSLHLLPRLTAAENVALPLIYNGTATLERRARAEEALARVGLGDRSEFRPDQLSGGQRQRVAIARALIGRPALLLADEPTGNLDSQNANAVMELLLDLNRVDGLTTIMVTHDPTLAARTPRRIVMRDGMIQADLEGKFQESHSAWASQIVTRKRAH